MFLLCVTQEDEKFLSEVFAQLTDEATDDDKRCELVSASPLCCLQGSGSVLYHQPAHKLCHKMELFHPFREFSDPNALIPFPCVTGELLQGILRLFSDVTTSEQRRVFQNFGKVGNSSSS